MNLTFTPIKEICELWKRDETNYSSHSSPLRDARTVCIMGKQCGLTARNGGVFGMENLAMPERAVLKSF